jgi:hypothetical protein
LESADDSSDEGDGEPCTDEHCCCIGNEDVSQETKECKEESAREEVDEKALGTKSVFKESSEAVKPHELKDEKQESLARTVGDKWVSENGPGFSEIEVK